MEKTIEIDGKKIRFKSTGATPLRYKAQFHKDFFSDILKLNSLKGLQKADEIKPEDIDKIDFDVLYQIAWTLAKTANKEIEEPIEWLDTFDSFPLMEVIPELQELIQSTIQAKKK